MAERSGGSSPSPPSIIIFITNFIFITNLSNFCPKELRVRVGSLGHLPYNGGKATCGIGAASNYEGGPVKPCDQRNDTDTGNSPKDIDGVVDSGFHDVSLKIKGWMRVHVKNSRVFSPRSASGRHGRPTISAIRLSPLLSALRAPATERFMISLDNRTCRRKHQHRIVLSPRYPQHQPFQDNHRVRYMIFR